MKIHYFHDTDTLYIELSAAAIDDAYDLGEDTLLELDGAGRLCAITIEHASQRIDHASISVRPDFGARVNLSPLPSEMEFLPQAMPRIHHIAHDPATLK